MMREEETHVEMPAKDPLDAIKGEVQTQIAGTFLKVGQESAQKIVSSYANIEWFRPYFDVEPEQVRARLLKSLRPVRQAANQAIPGDLYGPLVLAFTLVAVLLFSMKASEHQLTREGTLMGTAMAVSFGYWWTASVIAFSLGFIFNTALSVIEILSVMGYGLFGYCITLLAGFIWDGDSDFYLAWFTIGLLSSLNIMVVMQAKTQDSKKGWIVGAIAGALHWIYLLYLHSRYAHTAYADHDPAAPAAP